MSFSIATSGLNAVTEQLNAISNNIANSGTVGFKSGRAEFSALYAESQPLGVGVSAVTQSITKGGSITSTGTALDLAINGNGFFMVRDSAGTTAYTRAGYFGTDSNGNLVNNLGMYLQGYPVDASGTLQVGSISNLTISSGSIPAKATESIDFTANIDARAEVPATSPFDYKDNTSYNNSYTTQVYDSLGREHTLNQYFVKTGENEWQVHYYMDDQPVTSGGVNQVQNLTFNSQGILTDPSGSVALAADIAGADAITLDMSYSGTTQYGSDFSVSKNKGDGYASGERTGQAIDEDGSVYATFSNGERLLQGQLVLANFTNPNGLQSQDGTTWAQTASSGTPLTGTPGSGLLGSIVSGALESSNVDLTSELVGLMTAQRNYQANTKVISTNDSMMSALFQAV
ncbi:MULTISPECIES: flagellar hook protein FlgE [unclassified Klebsiella]|uniref:flagellar hook protein FlgE n=1 Tax=Enterobacteriaceae TaxID=543 RepID=UPI0015DCC75E|nr:MULTISPECIES: flagellar hook protein FlgE [unclassified Klebsiella]HAT3953144.1 flagellar basal body protein FlaE [Kluyvera ascorbata]BBR56746.1 flagellar hook protein FlgE [Klebsiella sp. WP4-W18-ESBL-05]BBS89495.1 flagellar hook protein FlgE [Klebsiella sp. WP7-S18-CRE-02]BBS94517.1 flagellar hook protein FlgE [Klebsiella sp. WP7-S18-CRE-03]BBS99547.1 flagellar hook protein FlgE [Klebsiella sp. WP7-S18-ESBL-04]